MASQVGSAEEIRKLRRLQELVGFSRHAVSNRICSKASPARFGGKVWRRADLFIRGNWNHYRRGLSEAPQLQI